MSISAGSEGRGFFSVALVRDVSATLLMIVIAFKLARADFNINLSAFDFNDLLSLILAIFSVALSVAFYFQADRSSKQFYDDSYKFTKDMSEILGRIEAGFGEKLRHIDESYSGLNKKFDNIPFDSSVAKTAQAEEEELIRQREGELKDIVDNLMQQAHMDDGEKSVLRTKIKELTDELENSKVELDRHKNKISQFSDYEGVPGGFVRYLKDFVLKYFPPNIQKLGYLRIARLFEKVLQDPSFDSHDREYMTNYGLLEAGRLTPEGASLVHHIMNLSRHDG